jgi:hypothetical protein
MQQDADFITADFLYMFRASCAHHQEYKILKRQPTIQVVMVADGTSLRHMAKWETTCNHNYDAWRPKHVEKVCSNKICILLHHVGVLFNLKLYTFLSQTLHLTPGSIILFLKLVFDRSFTNPENRYNPPVLSRARIIHISSSQQSLHFKFADHTSACITHLHYTCISFS